MGFELVGAFLLRDKGMASFMQETKQALIFVKLCIKTKFRATRRRRAVYLPLAGVKTVRRACLNY